MKSAVSLLGGKGLGQIKLHLNPLNKGVRVHQIWDFLN